MVATDPTHFRRTLGRFPTGVTVVTSTDTSGRPVGMACNSFTSVSIDPPLVLICAGRASTTWPVIRATGRFCVNILGSGQEWLCRRFGERDVDRFAGVQWCASESGPELDGALAHLGCTVVSEHDGGDHVVIIARVDSLAASDHVTAPLVFHRGHYGSFADAEVSGLAGAGVPTPATGRARAPINGHPRKLNG